MLLQAVSPLNGIPEVQYVGNMHGDEPLGRELVLLLADWLCDNYLKDSLVCILTLYTSTYVCIFWTFSGRLHLEL